MFSPVALVVVLLSLYTILINNDTKTNIQHVTSH